MKATRQQAWTRVTFRPGCELLITIKFGLALGTILTIVVVPALYKLFYRVETE